MEVICANARAALSILSKDVMTILADDAADMLISAPLMLGRLTMTLAQNLRFGLLALALVIGLLDRAQALPSGTEQSVVSVLPVWPGRAQGGTGAAPGVAPEGSGVVLKDGVIATAWHVIEPARHIDVRLFDGRILPARLIGHDPASDIAVLAVDAPLRPFEVAPDPALADPICSIGNAFGLGLSVACGVVSALHVSNAGFNPVEDFVQTDAAINPGSSGGALVDADGRLVGMVSAIFASQSDTNTGVSFAVSTELLIRVTDDLLAMGEVRYPDPGWQLAFGSREQLTRIAAPVVRSVADGGPADVAGIRPGDLILQIGARRVQDPRDATAALAVLPGDAERVALVIEREGKREDRIMLLQPTSTDTEDKAANPLGDCPHPQPVCLMRQAVFPVSSFDPLGSATRIGPDLVVTNRHVVGDRNDAVVHTPGGPRGARVVPSTYTGDLVLLEVDGLPEAGHIPELEGGALTSSSFLAVGADIARQEIRVFDSGVLIAAPAPEAELGRIHVTSQMQPGVSGGALVQADGQLVGIAVGGGDGRFEAIPLVDVRALLAGRTDDAAEPLTKRLGRAYADCADGIDTSAAGGTVAFNTLIDTCSIAMNHGQLLEAGRVLAQAAEFDGAAQLHGQAVQQVPNSINARISLLVSLQLGARFEEMTEHARFLMEIAPEDPGALRFAIQSGVWGGEPELAEQAYQFLLSADPRQAQAARRFIDNAPPAPPRRN